MLRRAVKKVLNSFGYDLLKINRKPSRQGYEEYAEFADIHELCREYTMTGIERMYALYKSVEYIVKNDIKGDFVECGVWRGGSSMVIAKTLMKFNATDRKIYLFDTFEGMSEPTEKDVNLEGFGAGELMKRADKSDSGSVWCYADLDDVKNNMSKTGYPLSNIHFLKGKVEDTLPAHAPSSPVALLRLDTDWYESTYHELKHLYPLLVSKGVLIIDDYGHWQGARQAVDEYFAENKVSMLLNRIDHTGRTGVKL